MIELGFTSHSTHNRSFQRRYSQPISWLCTGAGKVVGYKQTASLQAPAGRLHRHSVSAAGLRSHCDDKTIKRRRFCCCCYCQGTVPAVGLLLVPRLSLLPQRCLPTHIAGEAFRRSGRTDGIPPPASAATAAAAARLGVRPGSKKRVIPHRAERMHRSKEEWSRAIQPVMALERVQL